MLGRGKGIFVENHKKRMISGESSWGAKRFFHADPKEKDGESITTQERENKTLLKRKKRGEG